MTYVSNHIQSEEYISKNGVRQFAGKVNPWVVAGMQFGQLTIGHLLSSAGDGKGGSDGGKVDKKTQEQIDAKNKELNKVFEEVKTITGSEVTSSSAIKTAVTSLDSQIKNLESKVTGDKSSAGIQAKIDQYFNSDGTPKCSEEDESKNVAPFPLSVTYASLQQEKAQAIEIETQIQNKKAELVQLRGLQGQAENIELEILRLQDSSASPEIKYDVKEETNQLKDFNTALRNFTSIRNDKNHKPEDLKDAAKQLMTAYYGGSGDETQTPIIDNNTAQTAFRMVEKQVKTVLAASK